MATKIYNTKKIKILNGKEIEITPLKIKYLREFMDTFQPIKSVSDDLEAISILVDCARISMQQYCPEISSIEDIEDNLNMPMIYEIIDIAAGIKINEKKDESVKSQAVDSGNSWQDLDLAKLESEVFLLGIWKDYHDLEISLSMPELMATIELSRELNYTEKKFLAAIQGVDLDKSSGASRGQKEWEDMKARVFSRGKTGDSNDVLALQGQNAKKAGFGIGMGLDYDDLRDPSVMKS